MRSSTISVVLAMLLFRAYIPVGFMPASGTPFLLEICPVGMQAPEPLHHMHQHPGGRAHIEDCPFGSAPAAGPISQLVAFQPASPAVSQPGIAFQPLRIGVRLERAHQPRGPPALV